MRDAGKKGMRKHGSECHFAKLTEALANSVCVRFSAGESAISIARSLGIERRNVYPIIHGKTWKRYPARSETMGNHKIQRPPGRHTTKDIIDLLEKQGGKCGICKIKLSNKTGSGRYHIDHVNPIALGGSDDPDNLQLLCPTCNLRKNAKHPDEIARNMGLLFI
jgi:5-methylcytosine-specific restriction endonuclease McrA